MTGMADRRRARGSGSVDQLPSGKWRVRWYTRDGRHPSRTFALKSDAEKFLRRTLVDSERDGADLAPQRETLASLIDPWWATHKASVKPRTAERYELDKRIIKERIGGLSIRDLDYNAVQRFVDALSDEYAPRSVRGTYGVLALILKDAQRKGKLRPIPKPTLPRVGKPKLTVPTRDEVEALAQASDKRLYAAVILSGYCGLREGELLALHRRDVHLDEGWVFVHQARNKSSGQVESTKTEKSRRVYLPARVVKILAEHMDEHAGELLFPFSASVLQKSWERARTTCNLRSVRFHDLRHAAASIAIHAGLSVAQVSKQLGHANPTMTLNTYSHLWPDSYEDAIRKMDAFLDHEAS